MSGAVALLSSRISSSLLFGTLPYWSNSSYSGTCWSQWEQYWSLSDKLQPSTQLVTTTRTLISTFASASTYYLATSKPLSTSVSTKTWYQTGSEANHDAFATFTNENTYTVVLGGESSIPTSTGPTTYETVTEITTWQRNEFVTSRIDAPDCRLPSVVRQCQLEWNQWLAAGAIRTRRPACSQASMNSGQCTTAISAFYASVPVHGYEGIPAWLTNGSSTFWPTTMSCQQCAITGNNVKLLYWPPMNATAVEDETRTAYPSRLSSNGTKARTAVFDGVTLTSPTVYISYDTLYASNSCHGVGGTYKNTIIAVRPGDLSSLAYQPLANWAIGPGQWGSQELSYKYVNRAFDLDDLVKPIPDFVFNQLPFCQRELRGWKSAGFNESSFTCSPRDAPYAPLLAIPTEFRNLDLAWATCSGWYGGLFDPPKALQGVAAAATPTLPVAVQTTPASAGSTIVAGLPSETAGAYQPTTTPGGGDPAVVGTPTSQSLSTSIETPIGTLSGSFAVDPAATPSEHGVDPGIDQSSNTGPGTGSIEPSWSIPAEIASSTTGTIGAAEIIMSIIGATGEPGMVDPNADQPATLNALSILSAALSTDLSASRLPEVVLPSTDAAAGVSSTNVASTTTQRDPEFAQTVPNSGRGSNGIVQTMVTLPSTSMNPKGPGTSRISNDPQDTATATPAQETERSTAVQSSAMVTEIAGLTVTAIGTDGGVQLQYDTELVRLTAGGSAAVVGTVLVSLEPAGQLVVDTSTSTFSSTTEQYQTLDLGSVPVTGTPLAGESDAVAIGSTVLSVGGPARTISGQLVSAGTGGLMADAGTTIARSWEAPQSTATNSAARGSSPSDPVSPPASVDPSINAAWRGSGSIWATIMIPVILALTM
ncbi:hypothetical protein LTR56_001312 [Elasticomyces elasticus]|nr:hypothetical protein LTR56_001312 [Elasticomyces elasticus]KAK3667493.1 hypothetical protein LTR22_001671 [Elasticomyces elasticus]KAK4928027.1 hypothetical protein LTR49_005226 [Elasticomyces elasticus]KAK5762466.1 hypothetical protein LTS12_007443 [Elasticomyces elasticus]